jgi:hypothetical protein
MTELILLCPCPGDRRSSKTGSWVTLTGSCGTGLGAAAFGATGVFLDGDGFSSSESSQRSMMRGSSPFRGGWRVGFVGVGGRLENLTVCDAFVGATGESTSNLGTAGRDEGPLAVGVEGFFGATVLTLALAGVCVRAAFEAGVTLFATREPFAFFTQNSRSSIMCFSSKATWAFLTRASNSSRFFITSWWNFFEFS